MGGVVASILELHTDGTPGGLGQFKFLTVPSPGDRITRGNISGSIDIYEVAYVEHQPVSVDAPKSARQDPTLTVAVKWIGDWR